MRVRRSAGPRAALIAGVFVAAICLGGCGSQDTKPLEIDHHLSKTDAALFAYDRKAPLRVHVIGRSVSDHVVVEDLTYRSPGNGTIAAYLVRPKEDSGHGPALVFLHWTYYGPDRGEFLEEARSYARRGVVSLLVGETFDGGNIGMVVDVERGVDLLLEREHVDRARLGYVGHSLGAVVGGVVAGVETRFRTYVLMAGGTGFPPDPLPYVGHAAPASLFFQQAKDDDAVSADSARKYASAGSTPKRVTWYESGHDLAVPQAKADRAAWLAKELDFSNR